MMAAKVALLGAFDRFNYGDILFPIIFEKIINKYAPHVELEFYGTVGSDLRRYGGKRTLPAGRLFDRGTMPDGSSLVLAGGEILDANWTCTCETLLPAPLAFALRRIRNVGGGEVSDAVCRTLVGSRTGSPWVISPSDFSTEVRVVYNAVGGSGVAGLPVLEQERIRKKLSEATFLSVRDARTKSILAAFEDLPEVRLAPDCAVLLSELFPVTALETVVSAEAAQLRRFADGAYLCLQTNKRLGLENADAIAAELEKIYRRHRLGAVLLPIGRARNHEDRVALRAIKKMVCTPCVLASDELTIYDLMYVLSNARAFCGTSLHGNITAMSYGVPHLGLTKNVPKLEAFLETWDSPGRNPCVNADEIGQGLEIVTSISDGCRRERIAGLIAKSLDNFVSLFLAMGIMRCVGCDLGPATIKGHT